MRVTLTMLNDCALKRVGYRSDGLRVPIGGKRTRYNNL